MDGRASLVPKGEDSGADLCEERGGQAHHPGSPRHPHLRGPGLGLRQRQRVSPAAHEGHIRDTAQTKGAGHKQRGRERAGEVHRGLGFAVVA